jgi:hypothetical protein
MAFVDWSISVTYDLIGDIHLYTRKPINHWMLIDVEEQARKSGKSVEEVLRRFMKDKSKEE